jgi:hypothetical protein
VLSVGVVVGAVVRLVVGGLVVDEVVGTGVVGAGVLVEPGVDAAPRRGGAAATRTG